jgi:hypothetical protein
MIPASAYTASTDAKYNQVWKISKTAIDSGEQPPYILSPSILNWPGSGDYSKNEMQFQAPFFDLNADGVYDTYSGDYPCINGDQAVYFLYNDDRNTHTETQGAKMGVEIHALAYAFHNTADSAINNTIFVKYQIFNQSRNTYHNTIFGKWTDTNIGKYDDDFVGCDVSRNAYYGYNGTACDGTGGPGTYGCHPPAQGVMMLKGPWLIRRMALIIITMEWWMNPANAGA